MSESLPLAKMEEWVEVLATLVSRFYETLIRNNMPDDLARALTLQYQERILRQTQQ